MLLRTIILASVLIVVPTAFAAAESCDAGNGCSVDCDDGCSAVFYQNTNQCVAVCYDKKGKKKIATPITATFKNAAKADIERILGLGTKKTRPK
ncbi:MAG: hypothetical protein JSR72_15700 [Proteobacteria bacterium]|nr:hypothetical protein [Pseudomonadota bacterium]